MASAVGIRPKVSHDLMAIQMGGREFLGFIPEDYKNYLRSKRTRNMMVGDTGVDEDDLITNIFWTDAKMRADYVNFRDVISFDTTYRKNNEGRPIVLLVGVNHHKQSVLFGAALLYDETSLTFEWLFDIFTKAMGGKKSTTILTDQDAAMTKALASRWPETHHRLCIWHIYQNAAIHLSGVFSQLKEFANDFVSCVYDFDEEDDFISAWNLMLTKYALEDNDWLRRLFQIKEKWALVYGRHMFCADMTTTQRSESMNILVKRKFEFGGILCSHILRIFTVKNIMSIPKEYILKRWTRKAKVGYFEVNDSNANKASLDPKVHQNIQYKELCGLYVQLVTKATEREDTYKVVKNGILDMLKLIDGKLQALKIDDTNVLNEKNVQIGEGNPFGVKGIRTRKKTFAGRRLKHGIKKISRKKKGIETNQSNFNN
ncbi:protein FAR-RED IMPAIRED RESPONSE 1-like [Impatiens glandulifera]|uniref:protein FAR-RED IMPAIRED RESPONSE 1-like n=1 Tax=Impatiens glandulifera TaxID=253017 RepID=UPI001FB0F63E|nr:protein FAR-RED IMPAIRED RESPONSE 1-like [Impatiens glandulifera]